MDIVLIIIGFWFIVSSFIMDTKNIRSAVVFKVIPFFSGLFCIFYAVANMGIININI